MDLDGLVGHQKNVLRVLETIEELYQEHLEECGHTDSAEHRVKFYRAGIEVFAVDLADNDVDQILVYATLNSLYYTYLQAARDEIINRARIAMQN